MKPLDNLSLSGKEVLPIIEGGKGISASNGESAGAWARCGGIGTFSGVNADTRDWLGRLVPQLYRGVTRKQRHTELIDYAVKGAVYQAKMAHDVAGRNGRIHMNILWEMGAAEHILKNVLLKAKGLIHGVTCGAGMPYRLAQICASFGVYYYPIVSSARAFRALWLRAYRKFGDMLGAVVYEDPWRAGGHNGLSNKENPLSPEQPIGRVRQLRQVMKECGLGRVPIVVAGGVWYLREWRDWADDSDLAPVAFQFGTRPLLTKESPIPQGWKKLLLKIKKGDVKLHRFSPTGFYSSAVNNRFLQELYERSKRQLPFRRKKEGGFSRALSFRRNRTFYFRPKDEDKLSLWQRQGYTRPMPTPDETVVFATPQKSEQIRRDQAECMGCLSSCQFSNWAQNEAGSNGRRTDPRSFCIQKTLQAIAHGFSPQDNLMFAGHNAYKFAQDPFYENGFIPSVRQLVDRILSGD